MCDIKKSMTCLCIIHKFGLVNSDKGVIVIANALLFIILLIISITCILPINGISFNSTGTCARKQKIAQLHCTNIMMHITAVSHHVSQI